MARLRAPIALTVVALGVGTILLAFVLVKTERIYVGGLAWPFISDLGRDPPSAYVFFFGLSAVGVLLGLAWTFNHEYQHRFLQKSVENGQISPFVRSLSFVSCLLGVAGAIGLPLFASFDTSPTIHNAAAVVFLVTEALAMYVDTYLTFKIFQAKREELDIGVFITDRDGPRSVARIKFEELRCVKRGFLLQLACVSLFTIAVLVYLPLLYQAPEAVHLTIADCLVKELGEDYCKQRVRLDETNTKLWNYGTPVIEANAYPD
ncbi:Membrane protein [Globisporangium polare]